MKLVSWNVNGIRSIYQKGFLKWLEELSPSIICLQEVKAQTEQLAEDILNPLGYHSYWHCAKKPGYSGVAIYAKKEPVDIKYGIGARQIDSEGRVLTADFGDFVLVNSYFPNSQRDHARLDYKLTFCDRMLKHLNSYTKAGKNVLICGDFNIAHKEIDLKNPKQNMDNAGFLPQERAWMDKLLSNSQSKSDGYFDCFRLLNQEPEQYTWWSYRPTIRERNIGWRLDYFVGNNEFKDRVKSVSHQTQVMGSDHCPVLLELKR